ncbi:hypothetical protein HK101_010492 [Irineochytrium annulatum]|nr:hypothetical protein HK101_010492 [Irineochytrium annulatum]
MNIHSTHEPRDVRAYRERHPIWLKQGLDQDGALLAAGQQQHATSVLEWPARRLGDVTSVEVRRQYLVGPLPSDVDGGFTYGKPTRSSTPVKALLTDVYQRQWALEQEAKTRQKLAHEQERLRRKKKLLSNNAKHTAATSNATGAGANVETRRELIVDKDPKTLFRLSKFKGVPSKISCWRPSVAEAEAYEDDEATAMHAKVGAQGRDVDARCVASPAPTKPTAAPAAAPQPPAPHPIAPAALSEIGSTATAAADAATNTTTSRSVHWAPTTELRGCAEIRLVDDMPQLVLPRRWITEPGREPLGFVPQDKGALGRMQMREEGPEQRFPLMRR